MPDARTEAQPQRARDERLARILSGVGLGLYVIIGLLAVLRVLSWEVFGFTVIVFGAVDWVAPHSRRLRRAWAEDHQEDSVELGPGWAGSFAYSIFGRR